MLLPVPTRVPPQDAVYHLQRALLPSEPPFTVSVTAVEPQVESAEDVIPVGATEAVFTLITLVTQAVVLQVPSARRK